MDTPANYPVLSIQPDSLDFSHIEPKQFKDIAPKILLINNSGSSVLAGQIIPQVKWIEVNPRTFSLLEGETSQHSIQIIKSPPHYWTKKTHYFNQALIVGSNSGQISVSIQYSVPTLMELKPMLPGRKIWFGLAIFLIVLIAGVTAMYLTRDRSDTENMSREIILTIGAETIYAGQTLTFMLPVSITTDTPMPTYGSSSTSIPPLMTETTPTLQNTYTPWPVDQYPPPENLVYTYYTLLNNRDYDQAWSLLSENFQQNCCNEGLSQPLENYKAWWETIERVEILSGLVIQPGANPLKIQIKLKYFLMGGGILEDENIFSIIADSQTMRLLIDEVEPTID